VVVAPPRIFIKETPQELQELRHGHVTVQADKLLEPYLGKWMRVAGTVSDVHEYKSSEKWTVNVWTRLAETRLGVPMKTDELSLEFAATWSERLVLLKRDEHINVIGRIKSIELLSINLEQCELLDV
jgi:hypothetical protein